jgi:L-lactate dehydrogenase complex protein LldE
VASRPVVNLFVPCYVDQLYPEVGLATVAVLRRVGCDVRFDARQTCCGQPMYNAGFAEDAAAAARRHLDIFRGSVTVSPAGSCVSFVRHHAQRLGLELTEVDRATVARTYELGEFLVRELGITGLGARFPHKVALHQSCHGLRELELGSMSEKPWTGGITTTEILLREVRDIELVAPARRDECCGFGGTFAVTQAAVSARMGQDRCRALAATGAEYMTATDVSCLMHLDGIRRRQGGARAIHLAEILACR